jgi:predicted amidophosphoribosyltransferase
MNKKTTPEKSSITGTIGPDDEIEELIDKRRKKSKNLAGGFCPACGKPVINTDHFCSSCGRPITSQYSMHKRDHS